MSEERITLELLGARTLAITAELRDLQHRFDAVEARLSALETIVTTHFGSVERRLATLEERMTRMLALVVRIAERLDGPRE
ncbi:MAG: hypothetical protein ACREE4_11180 [Stellaceae bacterium]